MLGIGSKDLDVMLYGLEKGLRVAEIVEQTGFDQAAVSMISELVELTQHMRNPSMAPQIV